MLVFSPVIFLVIAFILKSQPASVFLVIVVDLTDLIDQPWWAQCICLVKKKKKRKRKLGYLLWNVPLPVCLYVCLWGISVWSLKAAWHKRTLTIEDKVEIILLSDSRVGLCLCSFRNLSLFAVVLVLSVFAHRCAGMSLEGTCKFTYVTGAIWLLWMCVIFAGWTHAFFWLFKAYLLSSCKVNFEKDCNMHAGLSGSVFSPPLHTQTSLRDNVWSPFRSFVFLKG